VAAVQSYHEMCSTGAQINAKESKYGPMFVAFDDAISRWDELMLSCVGDGIEGMVYLAVIVRTGCSVIDPDHR
jgi:hypothetical protein